LRRYARALLGDRAAADDLVQDTLERAWTGLHNGALAQIWRMDVRYHAQLARRSIAPTRAAHPFPRREDFEMPTRPTQSDNLEVQDIASALSQLPEEQREVLLLVALEEMSYTEIAATLGIPPAL